MMHCLKQLLPVVCDLDLEIFVAGCTNGACSNGGVGIRVVPAVAVLSVILSTVFGVVTCVSEDDFCDKSHSGILDACSPLSSIDGKHPSVGKNIV